MTDNTASTREDLARSIQPTIFASMNLDDDCPTYDCPQTGAHFLILPRLCEDIDGPDEFRYRLEITVPDAHKDAYSGRSPLYCDIAYSCRNPHHCVAVIANEVAKILLSARESSDR